ncbi:hypothetical protein L5515_010423 [Caenorhabditis briggsae]|uniref:Uncharacterized protein n=1 Tax=Caenorhabditis briggsae TaxID=6238 RepID=A0AAE9ETL0_CAEBR|nr:hypothetical protein L5515_010423 [Caenorhabditis briggsae]
MSHLKTEWILMKSVHFLGDYDYKPDDRLARDLTPLTTYSMNKKRRWEILENVGDQKLAGIGKFHRDLDPDEILFLERVNLKTFEWKYLPFVHAPQDFGIQTLHSYKMISKKNYSGQFNSDKQSTIIVYNFLRAPRNYMRLGEQYFVASNYGRREPYYAHRRRKLNYEDSQKEINNEIWRFYNNSLDELSEEVNGSEKMENLKYYDLYAHLKDDFVFVKKKIREKGTINNLKKTF